MEKLELLSQQIIEIMWACGFAHCPKHGCFSKHHQLERDTAIAAMEFEDEMDELFVRMSMPACPCCKVAKRATLIRMFHDHRQEVIHSTRIFF